MKKGFEIGLMAVLMACFFSACEEIGPNINLHGNQSVVIDTAYIEPIVATPEAKNVVIEEFTGVRCPNCPQGHQVIENIQTSLPNRVISVNLYPINSLGYKYPISVQDFTNTSSQTLFDYFGQIGQEPAAAVDRDLFTGETKVLLDKTKWANYANQQVALLTPVNVMLYKFYDTTNRELTITVELHYTQNVLEQNRLTVLLKESDIVSAQLDGSTIDTFYVHNNVMRTFITNVEGDAINTTREPGRVVRRIYKKILDAAWVPENMQVVAFVHEYQNAKTVFQGKGDQYSSVELALG